MPHPWRAIRALGRSAVFVMTMMPTRIGAIDLVTTRPMIEKVRVPTAAGSVVVDLYRPPDHGRHPGVVANFGIYPENVTDPRIAQIGEAFARAGFAALLYTSPTAHDLCIDRGDVSELVDAFETLLAHPSVDPDRSGFSGICVGSAFALMAAADPRIRDRVAFVFAYAPYSSMRTLAIDIASGSRDLGETREPWEVDPLTWKVYVRSVTAWLPTDDAARLRDAFEDRIAWNATKTEIVRSVPHDVDPAALTSDGRAALRLLRAGSDDIEAALRDLPEGAQTLLTAMSPTTYLADIAAPRIMVLHDRYDHVIPVDESRRLWSALKDRPGMSYTEMGLRHLRMPAGISPLRLMRELARTYLAWYPLFRESTA